MTPGTELFYKLTNNSAGPDYEVPIRDSSAGKTGSYASTRDSSAGITAAMCLPGTKKEIAFY
jgi:hypothetical protein